MPGGKGASRPTPSSAESPTMKTMGTTCRAEEESLVGEEAGEAAEGLPPGAAEGEEGLLGGLQDSSIRLGSTLLVL